MQLFRVRICVSVADRSFDPVTWMGRAFVMLLLAACMGFAGVPILAIMFAVAGSLMLDVILIASLLRLIGRIRPSQH